MTLLKCKNGHKWDYNGQNKHGEKATCPKCRKLVTIPSLIIAVMLVFGGIGIIYAEEQPLPLEDAYDLKYCVFAKVEPNLVRFTCNWDWLIPFEVLAQINQTTPPTNLNDLPIHNLALADMIKLYVEKAKKAEIEEQKRIAALPDPEPEPTTKEEREIEAAVKKLAECRTGLGAWAAYQEQAPIEHYTDQTRWEFAIRDNLSQSPVIGKMLKAIEECRIMQRYADDHLIGAYELNKILADQAGLDYLGRTAEHPLNPSVTDQSDAMVETDPVTPKDRADELADMEAIRDDLIEKRVFEDPDADFTGVNRGFQPAGLEPVPDCSSSLSF